MESLVYGYTGNIPVKEDKWRVVDSELIISSFAGEPNLDSKNNTSYPHSVAGINDPEDVPENYYQEISEMFPGKPVGFSEVMRPSLSQFGARKPR